MKKALSIVLVFLVLVLPAACSKAPDQAAQKGSTEKSEQFKLGPMKMNPHPASLEGKTVVLRWNGKFNGDKLLDRVAERLTQQVPGVKIVKLWTVDPATANTSENHEKSV